MTILEHYGEQVCRKHTVLACPPKCWAEGRTVLSYYRGELKHVRTYATSEMAQAVITFEVERHAEQRARYVELSILVPEQFDGAWAYRVHGA